MFALVIALQAMIALAWPAPAASGQEEPGDAKGKGAPGAEAPIKIGVADKDQAGELPDLTMAIGKRAAVAFAKGDWKLAGQLYEEILAVEPENPLALANLGAVSFQLKDYLAAQKYLEQAVGQNPKLVQARVTLGMAYFYADELYLAISHLTRAVHDEPGNARAHMYLAVVAQQAGWSRAAEEELRKAIAADPKYAEAHYNLALIYVEQSPPAIELARRHYYRALELGAAPDEKMAAQVK